MAEAQPPPSTAAASTPKPAAVVREAVWVSVPADPIQVIEHCSETEQSECMLCKGIRSLVRGDTRGGKAIIDELFRMDKYALGTTARETLGLTLRVAINNHGLYTGSRPNREETFDITGRPICERSDEDIGRFFCEQLQKRLEVQNNNSYFKARVLAIEGKHEEELARNKAAIDAAEQAFRAVLESKHAEDQLGKDLHKSIQRTFAVDDGKGKKPSSSSSAASRKPSLFVKAAVLEEKRAEALGRLEAIITSLTDKQAAPEKLLATQASRDALVRFFETCPEYLAYQRAVADARAFQDRIGLTAAHAALADIIARVTVTSDSRGKTFESACITVLQSHPELVDMTPDEFERVVILPRVNIKESSPPESASAELDILIAQLEEPDVDGKGEQKQQGGEGQAEVAVVATEDGESVRMGKGKWKGEGKEPPVGHKAVRFARVLRLIECKSASTDLLNAVLKTKASLAFLSAPLPQTEEDTTAVPSTPEEKKKKEKKKAAFTSALYMLPGGVTLRLTPESFKDTQIVFMTKPSPFRAAASMMEEAYDSILYHAESKIAVFPDAKGAESLRDRYRLVVAARLNGEGDAHIAIGVPETLLPRLRDIATKNSKKEEREFLGEVADAGRVICLSDPFEVDR